MEINVNTEKLAAGILGIIQEHPHGACLKLGMLPADVMESFEKNLERKIPGEAHKEKRREIIGNVTCEIIKQATEKNLCRV